MRLAEKQMLVRRNIAPPNSSLLQGGTRCGSWLVLAETIDGIDEKIRAAGWHLFRLVERIESRAIARTREFAASAALRKAMKRIPASRNAAEIVVLEYRSLLGLHLCRVSIAARHIQ